MLPTATQPAEPLPSVNCCILAWLNQAKPQMEARNPKPCRKSQLLSTVGWPPGDKGKQALWGTALTCRGVTTSFRDIIPMPTTTAPLNVLATCKVQLISVEALRLAVNTLRHICKQRSEYL